MLMVLEVVRDHMCQYLLAYVLKGKYDDELNWPFVGKVILNQLEDKKHHSIEVRFTPKANIHAGGKSGVILNISPILNSLVTQPLTHSTSKTTLCISG